MQTRPLSEGQVNCSSVGYPGRFKGNQAHWLLRLQRMSPVDEEIRFKWHLLVNSGGKVGHTFSQPDLIYRCLTQLSLLLRFTMLSALLREIETTTKGLA